MRHCGRCRECRKTARPEEASRNCVSAIDRAGLAHPLELLAERSRPIVELQPSKPANGTDRIALDMGCP
jgi:hypothetical protein